MRNDLKNELYAHVLLGYSITHNPGSLNVEALGLDVSPVLSSAAFALGVTAAKMDPSAPPPMAAMEPALRKLLGDDFEAMEQAAQARLDRIEAKRKAAKE